MIKVDVKKIILGLLLAGLLVASNSFAEQPAGTVGYAQERYKQAPTYTGPVRSGKQVYDYSCKTCHDRTTQGAPLPDDEIEWGLRAQKGMDVLMKHVKDGYLELMPENGGCGNCSDAELRAGIMYMLDASGVKLPEQSD